jgi:flagellar biosynthesis component FlhA
LRTSFKVTKLPGLLKKLLLQGMKIILMPGCGVPKPRQIFIFLAAFLGLLGWDVKSSEDIEKLNTSKQEKQNLFASS